jgi:SAM-dependent methyltransferase
MKMDEVRHKSITHTHPLRFYFTAYHHYRDGRYILPEDPHEQERLDLQHEMFNKTFGNKLVLAPISRYLHDVLDLGTGTGIWAIDFADLHPEANVIGIDLSPIQPSFTPPNCKFEVDDFEQSWTFKQKFDLIHGRMLLTSIGDPPKFFSQSFNGLKPGGWMEMQDMSMPITSDDGTMTKDCAFQRWNDLYCYACRDKMGRDPGWARQYKEWMLAAGFENVVQLEFKWPQNPWPKDPKMKELGRWNMVNTLEGLHGFSIRLLTRELGMTIGEVEVLLMEVRKDVQNRKIHAYWPM